MAQQYLYDNTAKKHYTIYLVDNKNSHYLHKAHTHDGGVPSYHTDWKKRNETLVCCVPNSISREGCTTNILRAQAASAKTS